MPLTIRDKDTILTNEISYVLAGNQVSDVNKISVTRQILEGSAASIADLYYDLYVLLQSFYIGSAEGTDLDQRGIDYGAARDTGQAASDPVTFTVTPLWIDDIPLAAPVVVQATLADGTQVLYRSLGDLVLTPSGRSVSGQAPATTLSGGVNDHLALNLDGDGVRTITLGAQTTATGIAAAIQAAVRALTAIGASHQSAYSNFRCDYGVTTPGAYTLRSGTPGPSSSVVVSVAGSLDASHALKLGVTQGGIETVGMSSLAVPVQCDQIGLIGNVAAGQINELVGNVPGIESVSNGLMLSNGREPASDDSYRQSIRTHLDSLGKGNHASVEQAVANTVGDDGQRHVFSSQVVYGAGTFQVYICDGRSLTVGCQADVIENVQDELDGLGNEVGGWIPSGNTGGVTSAFVQQVPVTVNVYLGPTPDLTRAKSAITNAIYNFLYRSAVGQLVTAVLMDGVIDSTVVEVYNIVYEEPSAFAQTPRGTVAGGVGVKAMPSRIVVNVFRA